MNHDECGNGECFGKGDCPVLESECGWSADHCKDAECEEHVKVEAVCAHCIGELPEPTASPISFCGTWCEQSWWSQSDAGEQYERIMKSSGRL